MFAIKVVNKSFNELPEYATQGSSGLDLRANLDHALNIRPMERKLIGTGLYLEISTGIEGQIRPRSGLALKQGITVLNTPGTVDSDYRGEIKVLLINLSDKNFSISPGDRIAQLVFNEVQKVRLTLVEEIAITERGEGGYGHTGIK